jgi:hypothetical protein
MSILTRKVEIDFIVGAANTTQVLTDVYPINREAHPSSTPAEGGVGLVESQYFHYILQNLGAAPILQVFGIPITEVSGNMTLQFQQSVDGVTWTNLGSAITLNDQCELGSEICLTGENTRWRLVGSATVANTKGKLVITKLVSAGGVA